MIGYALSIGSLYSARAKELPKLEIHRPAPAPIEPKAKKPTPRHPDEIYTRTFAVPSPMCLCDRLHHNEDEFEAEGEGIGPKKRTAQDVLEEAGLDFPEGTSASLNWRLWQLKVTHNSAGMAFVETYMASISGKAEKQMRYRVEIYRLPSLLVLELQESADHQNDHSPERNAVLKLAKKGQAKLITSVTLDSRSGLRSSFEDATEYRYLERYEYQEKSKETMPIFQTRLVGTIFAIDSVLGTNEFTMEADFSLEYHTAPPTQQKTQIYLQDTKGSVAVTLPTFHFKKISTSLSTISGTTRIIGTCRPTGKPEYEKEDLMDVVFLRSDVVFLDSQEDLQPSEP